MKIGISLYISELDRFFAEAGKWKKLPIGKSEFRNLPRVSLKDWKNGESRVWTFKDNGVDFTSGEYGLAYIYNIDYKGVDSNIFIRPKSPLAIGIQGLLDNFEELKDLTIKVTKTTGRKQSDTRYKTEVVEPES